MEDREYFETVRKDLERMACFEPSHEWTQRDRFKTVSRLTAMFEIAVYTGHPDAAVLGDRAMKNARLVLNESARYLQEHREEVLNP